MNKKKYPPLKKNSKKFIVLGVILLFVLIIAAKEYIFYPKIIVVVPPVEKVPVAPQEVVVEAPGVEIYDVRVCDQFDENYFCLSERNIFSTDEEFVVAYKFKGYRVKNPEPNRYGIELIKEIKIIDAAGERIPYPKEDLSPRLEIIGSFENNPKSMFSGEKLKGLYFEPGNYFYDITINDQLSGTSVSRRIGFTIQ